MEVLSDKFRRSGFIVFQAIDGVEGLKAALRQKPDLVVMDIVMPSLDGLQMLKKLREDKWGNTARVLILSNLSDPQQLDEARLGGVLEFMVKSNWSLEDVVRKASEVLGK